MAADRGHGFHQNTINAGLRGIQQTAIERARSVGGAQQQTERIARKRIGADG